MLTKRIIPCLDIKDGRTVKGTNFLQLRDAGDPVELARQYSVEGADELVFLDIGATIESRKTLIDLVERVGASINIPFSVGGGINDEKIVYDLLQKGADKVSVNSAAIRDPELITKIASLYGAQCLIVAIDAKCVAGTWQVFTHGGQKSSERSLFEWAKEAQERGAGEILFTSMDHDGTKQGFALEALKTLNDTLTIPIIASGGAGNQGHFISLFQETDVSSGLAASIFHYQEVRIPDLKKDLAKEGIAVRL